MSPRKKAISEEDAALFHTALKDAKPLKKRHRIAAEPSKPRRIFVPLPHFPGGGAAQFWWLSGISAALVVAMLAVFRRIRWI